MDDNKDENIEDAKDESIEDTKDEEGMNKYVLGLATVLIGIFIVYFYLVTQSWTELPFSYHCTNIDSKYGDVLVPLKTEGLTLIYSPDNGFNTCKTNIAYHAAPFISLIAGAATFGAEIFGLRELLTE